MDSDLTLWNEQTSEVLQPCLRPLSVLHLSEHTDAHGNIKVMNVAASTLGSHHRPLLNCLKHKKKRHTCLFLGLFFIFSSSEISFRRLAFWSASVRLARFDAAHGCPIFSSLLLRHSRGWKQRGAPVPCLMAPLYVPVVSAPWKWIECRAVWFHIKF